MHDEILCGHLRDLVSSLLEDYEEAIELEETQQTAWEDLNTSIDEVQCAL